MKNNFRDNLATAFSLLTIFPTQWLYSKNYGSGQSENYRLCPLVQSTIYWPVVATVIALLLSQIYVFLINYYVPPLAASALSWGCIIICTGGLHEDGWADMCDGLGGRTIQKRLTVMRDSHIGTFGVLGLILSLILRTSLLAVIPPSLVSAICLATIVPAYTIMALLPSFLKPARSDGLASLLGDISPRYVLTTICVAFCLGVLLPWAITPAPLPFYFLAIFPIVMLFCVGLFVFLGNKFFGGFTGDILGASCIVTETALLTVYVSVVFNTFGHAFF